MKYKAVIGLEVHVELKTKSKMFCACSNDYFGQEPNSHTCPVCLGLPGALPVPNKKAIEWCIMIGQALKCEIPLVSKFDRKNYFYPDLAKGYQISQYDQPFAQNGFIVLSGNKKVGIRRAHMEEDTGKLLHRTLEGKRVSLIDFNRSGVPLVEIVTEPDFETALEVKEYLQKLQQIVRYLGVSDADMEKGEMRLEPNISLRPEDSKDLPAYKVEVKNINSFKFVEKAINFEIKRQSEILDRGEIPVQETRGWDEIRQKTFSQRVKEEAQDYRYFPEPDIPPFRWTTDHISKLKSALPELPDDKINRFQKDYALTYYDAEILTRDLELADYYENTVRQKPENITNKDIANTIINKKVDYKTTAPEELLKQIAADKSSVTIDEKILDGFITEVIRENTKAVEDYKNGKEASLMFLLGCVMRKIGQKADTNLIKNKIIKAVSKQ